MKEFSTYHDYHTDSKIKLWVSDDIKNDKHPLYNYCILSKYNFPYEIELVNKQISYDMFHVYNHFENESPYFLPKVVTLMYINKNSEIVKIVEMLENDCIKGVMTL